MVLLGLYLEFCFASKKNMKYGNSNQFTDKHIHTQTHTNVTMVKRKTFLTNNSRNFFGYQIESKNQPEKEMFYSIHFSKKFSIVKKNSFNDIKMMVIRNCIHFVLSFFMLIRFANITIG